MNELDEIWAQKLSAAIAGARNSGRSDVAEYLALKAGNDALRATGVKWLFEALLEIAAHANRNRSNIIIDKKSPHQFPMGNSTLVGSSLLLRQGVRCLTLEAGWTRSPADGFMRGGALAGAQLTHFGIRKHNDELLLIHSNNILNWTFIDKTGVRQIFDSTQLNRHFEIFTGEM